MIDGFGEDGGDRVGSLVDDAGIALERVAEPVVVIGQEPLRSVQRSEEFVGVLAGALLALRAGAEPEPSSIGLQPRRATPPSVAQPVHERTLDRKGALLSAWRRRRDTPRLTNERVVSPPRSTSTGGVSMFRSSRRQRSVTSFVVLVDSTSARKLARGGPVLPGDLDDAIGCTGLSSAVRSRPESGIALSRTM
jgi:hypothetical protein